jgi:hypothetical protein
MTKANIAEKMAVQISLAKMMPADFAPQCVDAIEILWTLYLRAESSDLAIERV